MKINNKNCQTIWLNENNNKIVQVFDQRYFPHEIKVMDLTSSEDVYFGRRENII